MVVKENPDRKKKKNLVEELNRPTRLPHVLTSCFMETHIQSLFVDALFIFLFWFCVKVANVVEIECRSFFSESYCEIKDLSLTYQKISSKRLLHFHVKLSIENSYFQANISYFEELQLLIN